jgi:ribonuclease R
MNKIKYKGTIRINPSGFGFFSSKELEEDIFIDKNSLGKSLHLDEVEIDYNHDNDNWFVKNVVKRNLEEYVGKVIITKKNQFIRLDSKNIPITFKLSKDELNKVNNYDKVLVKIKNWKDGMDSPIVKISKVLGKSGDNDVEIHSILHQYNLPYEFPENVLKEVKQIKKEITKEEIESRRDLRDVTTICIDPLGSRDKDDVISILKKDNGITQVGIHIADVSHFVKPNSELDKEALKRGNSVYLVDRVIPMFPKELSNEICSLHPNEDKLTFSAIFDLDEEANILSQWYGKTIIHVDNDYTYQDAQKIIESRNGDQAIIDLDTIAKKLRKKRLKDDFLDFNTREVKFNLNKEGKPIGVYFKEQKDSNKLIEEFMLLANKKVSEFLNKKEVFIPNRVHSEPDETKIQDLQEFIKQFGYTLDIKSNEDIKKGLNKLLKTIKGTSEENVINSLIVKSMKKAEYSSETLGHYGLGFDNYSHFTSPIRRYADLMLHRILLEQIKK